MKFNSRSARNWSQGTPKIREDGQWVEIGTTSSSDGRNEIRDGGFTWDQTFTDTSWLYEADANNELNVEKVTTLDFEAAGGLYEAVDSPADPTVVVFEVGGVIEVPGHNWRIRNDKVWVAGETAPWPGIAITQCRTRVHDPEVILSHLSFMQGDQGIDEFDSSLDIDADDTMVDHCAVVWATEENLAFPTDKGSRSSVINTIIAEGLFDNPYHPDLRARGFLVNRGTLTELTHLGCLYAHTNRRMPMTRSEMVMCNNYNYNYTHYPERRRGGSGNIGNFNSPGHPHITAKGLVFEPGAGTPDDYDRPIFSYSAELYADDIEYPSRHPLTDGSQNMLSDPPLVPPGLDLDNDILPAAEVPAYVKANVGPRPVDRAPYERDLIDDRLQEPHDLIDSQNDVGGYPNYTPTSHTLNVPSTGIVDWIKTNYTRAVEVGK